MNTALKKITILLFIIISIILNSCAVSFQSDNLTSNWKFDQIRLLDPVDATSANSDLIAVYSRSNNKQIEIRLDYLDLENNPPPSCKVIFALDYLEGGNSTISENISSDILWDAKIIAEPNNLFEYSLSNSSPEALNDIQITSNIPNDFLTYTFPIGLFTHNSDLTLQIFIIDETESTQFDKTLPFSFNDSIEQYTPLLLAFWNTFPASTPSQALRYWDGAHTGPIGQRHGLAELITASSERKIPITLLDLKKPASIAALGYMGQLDYIRNLEMQKLLILPENTYGYPSAFDKSILYSEESTSNAHFAESQFLYGPLINEAVPQLANKYHVLFASGTIDITHIQLADSRKFIPLPLKIYTGTNTIAQTLQLKQLSSRGFSTNTKKDLIETALSPDPADIIVLGGDVRNSLWADKSVGPKTFEYIAMHPWIHPLSEKDILNWPTVPANSMGINECQDLLCSDDTQPPRKTSPDYENNVFLALQELPEGTVQEQAWETFLTLSETVINQQDQVLNQEYIGSVGHLIAAAIWEANPQVISNCNLDLDWDGQPECILATKQFFATFESNGARMEFVFTKNKKGTYQIIAPSYQFTTGLSDPKDWALGQNIKSDPKVIPGAFFDIGDNSWEPYYPTAEKQTISFFDSKNNLVKAFSIQGNLLKIQYFDNNDLTIQIPLVSQNTDAGVYKIQPDILIDVENNQILINNETNDISFHFPDCTLENLQQYTDTYESMKLPENANEVFPQSHFLPFPMSITQLQCKSNTQTVFSFEILD